MNPGAEISYLTLAEALQDIFVRQRTGLLRLRTKESVERFVFLGGQLYLSGDNPGRERLERILREPPAAEEDPRFDPRRYLDRELSELVLSLGETLASWAITELRFSDGVEATEDEVVGPVPTARLVMDLCSRGLSLEALVRRLGGGSARFRAVDDPRERLRVPHLDPDELALLRRLERSASVASLLQDRTDALGVVCRLIRLQAVGLVEMAASGGVAAAKSDPEVMQRISERVREGLESDPIDLEASEHRRRLADLLQRYSQLGHFDLLGVTGDATAQEVHAAFLQAARLAHPTHAERLGLAKSQRQLEWLFARLTEAYLVLSDPERASDYRRAAPHVPPSRSASPDESLRRSERERLAAESYRAALDHVENEDFHYAIEMLRQAVLHSPKPQYYLLLGRCQMQNRKWLHMAVDSFRAGLALEPDNQVLRSELSEASALYRETRAAVEKKSEPATRESADERRARRLLAKLRGERE